MIFNVHDQHIGRSLDLYGEWAESELELLGLFIKPGDVVVDVGANIGTHTVFFAQRAGATGQVYAFEPQRIVFQNLCANLALNGLLNVRAFHAAASREPGTIAVPPIAYARAGQLRRRRARGRRASAGGERRARAGDDARRPGPRALPPDQDRRRGDGAGRARGRARAGRGGAADRLRREQRRGEVAGADLVAARARLPPVLARLAVLQSAQLLRQRGERLRQRRRSEHDRRRRRRSRRRSRAFPA